MGKRENRETGSEFLTHSLVAVCGKISLCLCGHTKKFDTAQKKVTRDLEHPKLATARWLCSKRFMNEKRGNAVKVGARAGSDLEKS